MILLKMWAIAIIILALITIFTWAISLVADVEESFSDAIHITWFFIFPPVYFVYVIIKWYANKASREQANSERIDNWLSRRDL